MKNNGVYEQLLDKMPYVAASFLGIMCIVTLIYGIYGCAKKKNKQKLFVSVVFFINIIFVGFLMFAITEIIQMNAGENLSNGEMINLVLAVIGIVMFNVLAYTKLGKKVEGKDND